MFNRSPCRKTNTTIIYPDVGDKVAFGELVAGDFFLFDGKLYFKHDLTAFKEITPNGIPSYGTSSFSNKTEMVTPVNVEIRIK